MSRLSMILLVFWCVFAAVLLLVSLVVHFSTYLGIDPMEAVPGVMWIHLLIFPPWIAMFVFARNVGKTKEKRQDEIMSHSPRWLRVMVGVFFVYAIVNFLIFMILSEGGGPHKQDGQYVLSSHGRVIRKLTEQEFHRQQAHIVRGFSGHWMLFSSAALMILVGTARARRIATSAAVELPASTPSRESADAASKKLPPEPTTGHAALVSLVLYVGCVAMILSGYPVLSVLCVVPIVICALLAFRRRRGFTRGQFESGIGCLTFFPNGLLAWRIGRCIAEFIYVSIYAGFGAAATHRVWITFPKAGPAQLSNGMPLHNQVWSTLTILVDFPLVILGVIGLCYLAEHVGRFVEVRRRSEQV